MTQFLVLLGFRPEEESYEVPSSKGIVRTPEDGFRHPLWRAYQVISSYWG